MKMNKTLVILTAIAIGVFTSCVPGKKFDEVQAKEKACQDELTAIKVSNQQMEEKMKGLNETLVKDVKEIDGLRRDTAIVGSNYRNLTVKYDKLNQLNEQLMDKLNRLLTSSEKDNAKLSGDLQMTKEQLLKKEDELKLLEAQLNKQKSELDALSAQLKLREQRVNELEDILKKKDQATADLKKKLQDALFNFENKGLTITQKNGKVYVSLDESLLFASGKTAVEPKGVEALKNATTTPAEVAERVSVEQLRTWIQDFDYGGNYDVAEVKAQIRASYDVGLDSWMLWAPSNKYTKGALVAE